MRFDPRTSLQGLRQGLKLGLKKHQLPSWPWRKLAAGEVASGGLPALSGAGASAGASASAARSTDSAERDQGAGLPSDSPSKGVPLARIATAKLAVDRATFEKHQAALAARAAQIAAQGQAAGGGHGTGGIELGAALPVRRRASDHLPAP
ncbi:MAG: hypothetical protein RL722_2064, partial [Pseudomonadota bacterium]